MNLEGWEYLVTYGLNMDIYAKGNDRVGIDRDTGRVVIRYKVCRANNYKELQEAKQP